MDKEKYRKGRGPRQLARKISPTYDRITVTNIVRSDDSEKIGHNVTYNDVALGKTEHSIFIPSTGYENKGEFEFGPMACVVKFYVEQQEKEARSPCR